MYGHERVRASENVRVNIELNDRRLNNNSYQRITKAARSGWETSPSALNVKHQLDKVCAQLDFCTP